MFYWDVLDLDFIWWCGISIVDVKVWLWSFTWVTWVYLLWRWRYRTCTKPVEGRMIVLKKVSLCFFFFFKCWMQHVPNRLKKKWMGRLRNFKNFHCYGYIWKRGENFSLRGDFAWWRSHFWPSKHRVSSPYC